MPPTIDQVARKSGFTASTVSQILNAGGHRYRPETRTRVIEAARDLGYQANRMARSLVTGRTQMVAVHVVWLHTQFYAKICNSMQRALSAHGYNMMFQKLPEAVAVDGQPIPAPGWPVDGEIVIDGGSRLREKVRAAFSPLRPMVSVGVYCLADVDHVQIDVYRAARDAFEHLRATGRRKIGYVIDLPTQQGTAEPMIDAYRDFIRETGSEARFVITPDRLPGTVADALRGHLGKQPAADRPDALFCHGDIVAHAALRSLHDLGISVPDDIAVVGCGGGDETAYQRPSLTTIEFPIEEMARQSWEMLDRRMQAPDAPIRQVVLPAELVVRESSGIAM